VAGFPFKLLRHVSILLDIFQELDPSIVVSSIVPFHLLLLPLEQILAYEFVAKSFLFNRSLLFRVDHLVFFLVGLFLQASTNWASFRLGFWFQLLDRLGQT
jgi:hypothetical protein